MAENSVTLLICVLMIIVTQRTDVSAMGNCDTHNAICNFNGGLQGALQFREKHGFGCNNFGEDEGLYIDIDLEGFDPRGGVTDHNFRVKSFAGSPPNCSGMGSDFGRNARGADLGTFESVNGVVLISNHRLQQGPTLWGENTILGRSVAVTKGRPNAFQQTTPEILGCCIIGMASLQPTPDSGNSPFTPSRLDNPAKNLNSFNNSPPSASTGSFGLGRQIGSSSPFPGAGSPSFGNSAFKSPFNLDNKLSFFDLSGKTARAHSFSPNNVDQKFKAPEPPRFQDIYGLDSGESPLSRSGYGNTVGPSKGSSLSRLFFRDQDIKGTLSLGLTPEEMDIPRESGEEETSRSFHEDKAVDADPGYNDAVGDPDAVTEQDDPQTDSLTSSDTAPSSGSLPPGYGNSDPSQASYLPAGQIDDNDPTQDVSIRQDLHAGQQGNGDQRDLPQGQSGQGDPAHTGNVAN